MSSQIQHNVLIYSRFFYDGNIYMSIATLKRKTAALRGQSSGASYSTPPLLTSCCPRPIPAYLSKTTNSSHRTARIRRCCPETVHDPSHESYDEVHAHIECGEESGGGGGGEGDACVLTHVMIGGRHVPYRNSVKHLDRTASRTVAKTCDDYIRELKNKSC